MLRGSSFSDVLRPLSASLSTRGVLFVAKVKGKTKQKGSRRKGRLKKTRKIRSNKSDLDHVIQQSQDVLSLARPFSIYHPPPYITPEVADDVVLYKDGEAICVDMLLLVVGMTQ